MPDGYTNDEICEIVKRLKAKGIICHPDSAYCNLCDRGVECQEVFTQFDKEREVKMMESEHEVNIIDVAANNIDEVIDDIDFPKDEMGLREFLEDNKRHHRRGH